jgi:DNA end-binding protein Ku
MSTPIPTSTAEMAPLSTHLDEPAGPHGRPSWSGLLRLSLVAFPVKAYPAHSSSSSIQFNQLHANCGRRIQHQKRCPVHGPVEAADIVRGFQYARDHYVVVEPAELDKVRPARDKALVLEHFFPHHQIDPVLFAGRSLYLLPDGSAARHPYGVVAEALRQQGQWAIGRVVLSTHRQLVLVRPLSRLLVLDVLHYPAAIRAASSWETDLHSGAAKAEEIRLMRLLLDAGGGPLDWSRFRDDATEELTALLDAKIAGQPLAAPVDEPVVALHLLEALKQSVAATQNQRRTVPAKTRNPSSRRPIP